MGDCAASPSGGLDRVGGLAGGRAPGVAVPGAGARYRGRTRGCFAGFARLGGGELAGLPEQEDLFQAAENAGEDRRDDGLDGRRQEDTLFPWCLHRVAQAGEGVAQGGCLVLHGMDNN